MFKVMMPWSVPRRGYSDVLFRQLPLDAAAPACQGAVASERRTRTGTDLYDGVPLSLSM